MSLSVWFTYQGVKIYRVSSEAYTYQTGHIALDADGAPDAYGPGDIGLDYNANAGYVPGSDGWENVLVADPDEPDQPYVQTSGATAGYFVSMTSLIDESAAVADTDPAKYVDATAIPYIVFPGDFYDESGTGDWGDVAMVRSLSNNQQSAAIIADGGPATDPLGEISLALAAALGGTEPDPRDGSGVPPGPLQVVIFPYSHKQPAWPRTLDDIQQQASDLLQSIGGWPTI